MFRGLPSLAVTILGVAVGIAVYTRRHPCFLLGFSHSSPQPAGSLRVARPREQRPGWGMAHCSSRGLLSASVLWRRPLLLQRSLRQPQRQAGGLQGTVPGSQAAGSGSWSLSSGRGGVFPFFLHSNCSFFLFSKCVGGSWSTNMKSVSKPIPNFDGISVFSHSHRQCFPVTDLTSYATCRAQAASPTTSAANQNLVPRP